MKTHSVQRLGTRNAFDPSRFFRWMDNNMHGTTTAHHQSATRNQASFLPYRQFLKGRRGEMVRRATPAPALDKNSHPLHVFPLPTPGSYDGDGDGDTASADNCSSARFGAPRVTSAHNWLERCGKLPPHPRVVGFSMPPCSSMRRPAGRTTTSPLMSHQSSLTRSATDRRTTI